MEQGGPTHRGRQGASCVALPRPVTPKTDVFIFLPPDTRKVNIRLGRCGGCLGSAAAGKYCELRVIMFLEEAEDEEEEGEGQDKRAVGASRMVTFPSSSSLPPSLPPRH